MGWAGELGGGCPALLLAVPQVNLLVPVAYLVFWAFLLVFSFISEPMVCGVGVIIILTGVPIFFLGAFWRSKPKCVHRLTGELGSSPRGRGLEIGPSLGFALKRGSPGSQGGHTGPSHHQTSAHGVAQVSGSRVQKIGKSTRLNSSHTLASRMPSSA